MSKKWVMTTVIMLTASMVFILPLMAQGAYSIKEMTPEVEAALEGRRGRYDQLSAMKSDQSVGENNKGYVQKLDGDSSVDAVVEAENRDRKVIYQTIFRQNELGDDISVVEDAFAQVQRDKAGKGEKIQTSDGHWIEK